MYFRRSWQSPTAKENWLSIYPRNFGRHINCTPFFRPPTRPPAPLGNQPEISRFLASVGTCKLILHTSLCCGQLTWLLSKLGIRWLECHAILPAQVSIHRGYCVVVVFFFLSYPGSQFKLLVFNWSQHQLQVDFFAMVLQAYRLK